MFIPWEVLQLGQLVLLLGSTCLGGSSVFSPGGVLVLDCLLLVFGTLLGSVLASKRPMLLLLWYSVLACAYTLRGAGVLMSSALAGPC